MKNIIWLEQALNHLQHIYDFYAETNEEKAFRIISEISETTSILKTFPDAAPIIQIIPPGEITYRGLLTYKKRYKIIYCQDNNSVYIFAVWDCCQNPETLIKNIR